MLASYLPYVQRGKETDVTRGRVCLKASFVPYLSIWYTPMLIPRDRLSPRNLLFLVFDSRPLLPPGILRTAVPDMDRESRDEYLVVLQAKDMGGHLGGLSGTTTVTVKLTDVNDNPPHFRRSKSRRYHPASQGR